MKILLTITLLILIATFLVVWYFKRKRKVKKIYCVSDFPKPINGVIQLKSNTTYRLMNDLDLGDNTIVIKSDTTIMGD